MNSKTALNIAHAAAPKTLTPEHKRFQTLLGKMDKARLRLQHWQEQLPLFALAHAETAGPVLQRLRVARRAWAFELEQHLLRGKWSKAEKQTLKRHIADTSGGLIESGEEPDEELKALFNRHSEHDFDEQGQQQLAAMKAFIEQGTGVDLGDEPVESMDELFQRARAQVGQEQARTSSARKAAPRKPTAAQQRAQHKAQADAEREAARVSQTVRDIYRKLAATLHPDRCPADASSDERAARTSQMAQVNAAYAADDLLTLLSLQLQIEQVDMAHAAGVAAEQVKHFNKVLAGQLAELEAEVEQRQLAFCASYGLMTEQRLDPLKLGVLLKDEMRELAAAEQGLLLDQRQLRGSPAQAKQFLKALHDEQRMDEVLGGFAF